MKTRPMSRRAGAMIATALVLVGTGVALPASGALSLSVSGTADSSAASAVQASSVCGSAAGGYYQVAADGGVFTFGGARFYGSMAGKHLNAPIVGIIPTANDGGYWLVAADGGIFSFGDAKFAGSMGGKHLNMPVVGGAALASGGCPGPQGVPGTNGTNGNTILSGTTAPPASTLGAVGDFYLDTATEMLYGPKTSTGWPSTGTSLVGPQGPAGINGTNGTNGNTILSGTTAPASTVGANGDFYLDTSAPETLYGPKASGAWPTSGTSLVGPQGPAGTNGQTILNGTTASPPSTLGTVGDFYLDTATEVLYGPKTSSGWPSSGTSLIGPQGPSGITNIATASEADGSATLSSSAAVEVAAVQISFSYAATVVVQASATYNAGSSGEYDSASCTIYDSTGNVYGSGEYVSVDSEHAAIADENFSDNGENHLPAGTYTIYLECARQAGTDTNTFLSDADISVEALPS
jgi:hypothetical protein